MTTPTYLVADLFCGAGGSSTGAQRAITASGGEMQLVAVNHWPLAVRTHQINHPNARHIVEDVSIADPEALVPEGRLDLLMASPECTFHSRARGGKPIYDQGRMNPWAVHNWLTKLNVGHVLVENVPEFVHWGPLDQNGRPDREHRDEHFQAWFLTFQALGYEAQWRMLCAADYGDATTRVRFFLQARNDGLPITWPEPSHAKGDTGMFPGRLPWRGAREVINWDNLGRSLLDDPKYLRKPLSIKTRQRIARGLQRFGGPLAPLYMRLLNLEDTPASASDIKPEVSEIPVMQTMIIPAGDGAAACPSHAETEERADAVAVPEPFTGGNRNENVPRDVNQPIPTVTTALGGGIYMVEPGIAPFMLGQQSNGAARSTGEPVPTVAAAGAISLVRPAIIKYYGQSYAQDPDDPLSSVTRCNKHGLVCPTLIEYYGNSDASSINDPVPTVTTKARHGLANPTLVEVNHAGETTGVKRRIPSLDDPAASPTTRRGRGLANPAIINLAHGDGAGEGGQGNDRRVHPVETPLGRICPLIVQSSRTGRLGNYVREPAQPIPTLTTKNDMNPVNAAMESLGEGAEAAEDSEQGVQPGAVSAQTAELVYRQMAESGMDPRRIIFVDGRPHLLDIRFRMLSNTELARAMGFNDAKSAYEFAGNVAEVTKQIGNAIPVRLAEALVGAALDLQTPGSGAADTRPAPTSTLAGGI